MKVEYKVEKKSTVNELSLFEKNIYKTGNHHHEKRVKTKNPVYRESSGPFIIYYYMLWMNNGLFVHFGSTNWYPRAENSISRPL